MRLNGAPRPDPGTAVSLEAVRALAARSLAADRVVLGVGGRVPRDSVELAIESATSGSATFALEVVRRGGTERLSGWPEAVRAVTVEEVMASARRYLDPAGMVTVVVGPLAKIRAARHPRWGVSLEELRVGRATE